MADRGDDELLDTAPRTVPSVLPQRRTASDNEDEEEMSDGELLESLEKEEEDFDWGGFREKRMEQMQADLQQMRAMQATLFGKYTEMKKEKDLIETAAKEKYVVIHFFHRDFKRCRIMDTHLAKLAPLHPLTLFLKASVENVPWLVQKMSIKVLPCVMSFISGAAKDKLIGFEDLGEPGLKGEGKEDQFKTGVLEWRFKHVGVIPDPLKVKNEVALPRSFDFSKTAFGGFAEGRKIRQGGAGRGNGEDSGDEYA